MVLGLPTSSLTQRNNIPEAKKSTRSTLIESHFQQTVRSDCKNTSQIRLIGSKPKLQDPFTSLLPVCLSVCLCSFTRARGHLNKIKEQNRWQNKPSGRLTNKQTQQTKTTNKQTAKQTKKTKKQTNKHTHANKHANTHTHKQTKQTNKQPNKTHRHKQTN